MPYLGRSVQMDINASSNTELAVRFHHWRFEIDVPTTLVGDARADAIRADLESWYRERAALKLPERVERVSRLSGVIPGQVLIRDQRTRWASCAPEGTLRFNWRVIMAPPAIIDYIVAHELAHMRVQGHTADYWALVSQMIPDYRLRRSQLRDMGPSLRL